MGALSVCDNGKVIFEATCITYYSDNDEAAFFEWLDKIKCVDGYSGKGGTLFIKIDAGKIDKDYSLRELLALFYRYDIDMSQLAIFDDRKKKKRQWFSNNPQAYWFKKVFPARYHVYMKSVADQWRALGFHYEVDDNKRAWVLTGSKEGLRSFYELLIAYINDPSKDEKSEHEHYGPYLHLKIMTWDRPGIDGSEIFGTKHDLARLAELFNRNLDSSSYGGQFVIAKDYASDCEYSIEVYIKEDGFDPSGSDEICRDC